jgi:hypothetical protein
VHREITGFHQLQIIFPQFFFQKQNCIPHNPVVAGLAAKPEDYCYSSQGIMPDWKNTWKLFSKSNNLPAIDLDFTRTRQKIRREQTG